MNTGTRIEQLNEIQTVEQLAALLKTFGADNIRLSSLSIDCETRAHVRVAHMKLSLTITETETDNSADDSYDRAMGIIR